MEIKAASVCTVEQKSGKHKVHRKSKKGRKQMKNIKSSFAIIVAIISLFILAGCSSNTYTTIYYGEHPQIATPESAQNDYDYIYYYCNNKWHIDKLLWYETVDGGENFKFATIADNGTVQQHYANMSNVHLFTKIKQTQN